MSLSHHAEARFRTPRLQPPVPSRRTRLVVAIIIGIACGVASWLATRMPGFAQQDFAVWWLAARNLLAHQDPYTAVRDIHDAPAFLYPLPTAIATIPFAWMPVSVAGPLFIGLSCSTLAFLITVSAWWPLLMFLSGSMALSIISAQSTPLLTAALLAPSLTWLGVLKPNIGLAMLAHRPSWKSALIMLAIAVASLVVMLGWPREWIASARASQFHFAPWRVFGGILLIASVTRWRRPEARMLAVLTFVPSSPIAYEALPLFVIPQTKREMMVLALLSDVMFLVMSNLSAQQETAAYFARARLAIVWLMYLPALTLVLRRPNRGDIPIPLERHLSGIPAWLRGMPERAAP